MEKAINYLRIVGWESVILGSFMMVKIPEAVISFFISTDLSEDVLTKSPRDILNGLLGDFSWLALAVIVISLFLIIGGAFMIKGKKFGRTTLEITYWALLLVTIFNFGHILFSGLFGDVAMQTPIYFGLLLLPFVLLISIMAANVVMLRNNDLKRFLSE